MRTLCCPRPWHWPHLALLLLLGPAMMLIGRLPDAALLGAWLVLNLAVLAVAERWWPARDDWHPDRADLARDGSVLAANGLLDAVLKLALAAAAAHLPLQGGALASTSWLLQFAIGALLADLGSYAMHRWSHRGGWLWRVHAFHHRPEALNAANALTVHPINAAYDGVARTAPLVLLGVAPSVIVALALFHLTQALAAHANVRGTIGPLRHVLGNAAMHRLHHSARDEEAGNFGTDLAVWDRAFGTYREGPMPIAIGVFHPAHYPPAHAWWRLLAWPFCLSRNCRPRRTSARPRARSG
jgi:sterol desaturase/sphingolipid hydroxylase (fatty acid hydroxylase superfamily)